MLGAVAVSFGRGSGGGWLLAGAVGGGAMRSELAIGVLDCLLWRVAGEGGKAMRWRRCSGLWPFRLGGVPGGWLLAGEVGGGAMRSELPIGVFGRFALAGCR